MNIVKLLFAIWNVFGAIFAFAICAFIVLTLVSVLGYFLISQMDAIFGDSKFETWQIVADVTLALGVLSYFIYREYKRL